jgi:hypothetical protein
MSILGYHTAAAHLSAFVNEYIWSTPFIRLDKGKCPLHTTLSPWCEGSAVGKDEGLVCALDLLVRYSNW